jgi:hypothetical protein
MIRELREAQIAHYKKAVQACDGFCLDVGRYRERVEKLNNEAKGCKDLI